MEREEAPKAKLALWRADLILLFCTFIWGGTFVGIKICLEQISPFFLVFFRFSLSGLLFFLLFHREIRSSSLKDLYAGLLLGLFLLFGFGFQTLGLRHTSVLRSAFLTEALVIFVPFLQLLILRRPLLKSTLLGILIVFLGIIALHAPQIKDLDKNPLNVGDAWTLLCALAFSFFIIFVDRFKSWNPKRLMFFQSLGASLGAFVILFFSGEWEEFVAKGNLRLLHFFSLDLLLWIFYLAFLANGLAVFLQLRYQPSSNPARAGVIFGSEPVIASLLGFFLLGEGMKGYELTGVLLVIFGILAMELIPLLWEREIKKKQKALQQKK